MNGTIVPDFLENLKLAGIFAEDDKAFGAENLLGEGIQELLESSLFNKCREGNFTGGEVVFRVVVVETFSMVGVFCFVSAGCFERLGERGDFCGEGCRVGHGGVDAEGVEGFFHGCEAFRRDDVGA